MDFEGQDSFSCNMSSSKSKRAPAYSSDESTNCVSDDSIEKELEESSKYLPSGKKLTEGRKYIFVKKQTEMSDGDKDDEKHGDVNLREVRKALIYMIIVDGLSFQHVMKSGFRHFISVVCPGFLIPSGLSLARDCYRLYLSEKSKLKEQLHNSCQRICVTTDTWTSIQDKNYLSVTAHFIDNDWELHKKIINFFPMFTQQGEAIGKGIKECLESWGLEDKLFTVTVDNASYNDFACTYLRKMAQQTGCVSDGKYLQIRCIAHVINVIVSDAIEENGLCIERVRHAVKFVKVSPARKRRFKDLAQKFNVESKCYLCLDDPTNWNSTYMMLETAMKFQRVFSALNLPDEMGVSLNERPPDAHDWKKIERLIVFLEGFYLFTRRISNSLYVTSNKGLYEIMALNDILKKWVQNVDLDFQAMAISMKQKYDKYWGNVEKMNMLIYIAVILDPHSKLIGVQLILMDMYGKEKGEELANAVKNYAYSLFEEYRSMHSSLVPQSRQNIELSPMEEDGLGSFVDYMKSLKDRVTMMKGTSGCMISEFDRYLNEQIGEKEESDTLSWWGNNGHRFPIVSRMARDILAIPLSTSFSVGGCQLDPYRSALPPMMVQTLVCGQDWLRQKGEERVDLEETLPELLELEEEFENNNLEDDVVNVDPLI